MNWYKESQEQTQTSTLDGKRNESARNYVRNIAYPFTKGIFSDNSWENVNKIWKALDDAGINNVLTDAQYGKDEQGNPSYKTWKFEVYFTNNKGKPTTLYGNLTAHGAGTVNDPLSKYDITFNIF